LCDIRRLAEAETSKYIVRRDTEMSEGEALDEHPPANSSGGDAAPKDEKTSASLALMVELALQEALSIATLYEREGLRLNNNHRRLLQELGNIGSDR
jgi:hypothetical protein